MNFLNAVQTCFQKYTNVSDLASQEEFGYWMGFVVATYSACFALTPITPIASAVGLFFLSMTLIPTITVAMRRRLAIKRSLYWRARLEINLVPSNVLRYA